MGCWNETCGITQLPINAGDKVRVFFIVKNDYGVEKAGGGYSYANDIWYPRGLPIQGKYNEYGGVEDDIVEDISATILLDGIKKDWATYKARNQWEKDIDSKKLNLVELVDLASQDHANIYDGDSPIRQKRMEEWLKNVSLSANISGPDNSTYPEDRDPRSLGIMFVHEEVYQAIVNWNPTEAHHSDDGYEYKPMRQILEEDMFEWYTKGLNDSRLHSKDPIIRKFMREVSSWVSQWNTFSRLGSLDPPFCKGISYYIEFLQDKMTDSVPFEDHEVQTVCRGLIEFMTFKNAMYSSRRSWIPQCGKGSQQNETAIHKVLANTVLSICHKEDLQRAQFEKEYEETLKKAKAKNVKKGKQVSTKKT